MKIYKGRRPSPDEWLVTVSDSEKGEEERPLPHIEHHSPDGFSWGYGGSGPSDLALSILADYLGEKPSEVLDYSKRGLIGDRCRTCTGEGFMWDSRRQATVVCAICEGEGYTKGSESLAWEWHHALVRAVVAGWPMEGGWTLTGGDIEKFVVDQILTKA